VPDDPTVDDSKPARRARILQRRALLTAAQRAAAAAALAEAVTAALARSHGPVAAYASFGTEPDTGPLRAALRARTDVLLPVLEPDGDLDWALDDGRLAAGPGGLAVPTGPRLGRAAVADCGLLVVPALAVDRAGTRLGRGGGSYDRALARARGWVVAALHAGELVPELPAEPHDRSVHAVALPDRGLVELRPHPGDGAEGPPAGMSA
jgi:5-formyltetrahydrofolate cyclo-ligase